MSTSPVDQLDPIQYPGKTYTASTFNLRLEIEPGSMIDHTTWVPGNTDGDLSSMPYHELQVHAWFGNTVLINNQPLTRYPILIQTVLTDHHHSAPHEFGIRLTGKNQNHTYKFDSTNKDATAMIRVKCFIENLPVNLLLEELYQYHPENGQPAAWSVFMGQNGTQLATISTPIYPWLVEHHQHIVKEISTDNT